MERVAWKDFILCKFSSHQPKSTKFVSLRVALRLGYLYKGLSFSTQWQLMMPPKSKSLETIVGKEEIFTFFQNTFYALNGKFNV